MENQRGIEVLPLSGVRVEDLKKSSHWSGPEDRSSQAGLGTKPNIEVSSIQCELGCICHHS